MRSKAILLSALSFAVSVFGMAAAALPASAQTGALLRVASGNQSVTIDSNGNQTYVNCSATACPGTATAAPGSVTWSGTIGGITVLQINARTKPALTPPNLDVAALLSGGANGGALSISWTDNGFTVGESPATMNIVPGQGGSAVYTGYVDNSNAQFGMGTMVGTTTTGGVVSGPGPTANPFSMTIVEAITVQAGATFNNDFSLLSAPNPPLTLSCGVSSGVANVAYSSSLIANGGVSPYVFTIVGGSISPLSLNGGTGAITGTPLTGSTLNFTAQVVDSSGNSGANTVTTACSIVVAPPPPPSMTLVCPSTTTGQVGSVFNSSFVATGGLQPYTFSLPSGFLPAGLSLNAATGAISGTPTVAGAGTATFTGKVVDSTTPTPGTASTTGTCSISISLLPITSSCIAINAVQGVAITPVTLSASGGAGGPYTYSGATGLPSGLSISSAGVISGTPTASGTFSYSVTIKDAKGNTGTLNCSVTVIPQVTSSCVAINATQGTAINPVTLSASGGAGGPYTFSQTGLPAGLTMSAGGVISGTPQAGGVFAYTVTIKDKSGNTGTLNCSVNVLTVAQQGTLSLSCVKGAAEVGVAYSSSFVATGGAPPYTYSISAGALPAGLTLNTSTGAITGTPTKAGTSGFTAKVVDSLGFAAYSTCTGTCAGAGSTVSVSTYSTLGNLGNSRVFSVQGTSLTAYGFNNNGTPTALYAKNQSSTEQGLGIASDSDYEINTSTFIQLDVSQLVAAGFTNAQILFNSVQAGEGYNVYGSNTLGTLGAQLGSTGVTGGKLIAMPGYGTYKYIGIRASAANIDIGALAFTAPATTCSITVVGAVTVQCSSSSATVGQSYSSTLQVTGGAGPYTFSVSWGMLPAGLTLNTSTGVISGTPTTSQTGAFQIKVVDANGGVGYSGTSGSCSSGTTISYGQNGSSQNSDGDRGISTNYTSNNLPLRIYGYSNNGSQAHLWANNSWDNPGLGIGGSYQNALDSSHFIQCDISSHTAGGASGYLLNISGVEWNSSYDVYGSNTLGSRGTLLQSNVSAALTAPQAVPGAG
ncbi:MAG: Ig domain-containing protein, partial [Acidobacteriota bacterium]|nr:Ig domain-containing protein [Acidobacteriota bacterium]